MKPLVLLAVLCLSLQAAAQNANTLTLRFPGAPSGPCAVFMFGINNATNDLYDCNTASAWVLVGTSSAAGVTSFNSRTGAVVPQAADYGLGLIGNPAASTTFAYATNQHSLWTFSGTGSFDVTGPLTSTVFHGPDGSQTAPTYTGTDATSGIYFSGGIVIAPSHGDGTGGFDVIADAGGTASGSYYLQKTGVTGLAQIAMSGFSGDVLGGSVTGDLILNDTVASSRILLGANLVNTATTGTITTARYNTLVNCAAVGTAANPSIASCGAAGAGSFSCATNASTGTCQVNDSLVTANSQIFIQEDSSLGTRLSVTCNTTNISPTNAPISARNPGVSFTINLGTVTGNPECFNYFIVN